ncbi:MAG: hypothetical protein AAGC78_18160 [Cellvibrio sp.]|uniref:hypothetical protein n=1 Tax=Cellvibrio sp. TaxID=1965322 RepID=UPI0031ACD634
MNSTLLARGIFFLFLSSCLTLVSCGGGGGGGSKAVVPVSSQPTSLAQSSVSVSSVSVASSSQISAANSSQSNSSANSLINLTGRVTYDFVPHNDNKIGLNYSAVSVQAGRGLVVELLDSNNLVLATTNTDSLGNYSFMVDLNKTVKIRVKAQLLRTLLPVWNFKVTDNTSGNSLYVMDGTLVEANQTTAIRNLHAGSGWTGTGYTQPRVAAPFAILDSIYGGLERIAAVNNSLTFSPLEFRWSVKNKAADGNLALGEIGTSFYGSSAIYILGDENNDTDEYDRHVILHEWGHYLEDQFSRSDSIGGDHMYGDKMDMRVAMSEGFANAFSAMMLDDPDYRDASGVQQVSGFASDISRKSHTVRGWYSEASIQSVLYNFYKNEKKFSDIFNVISSSGYASNSAMISIYVFANELRTISPQHSAVFNSLLFEQNIENTNAFGVGESNSGGYAGSLPLYKVLAADNTPINVCSTNRFGSYNKLAVSQFLLLDIPLSGAYQFSVQKAGGDSGSSDPDIYLYRRGELIDYAESSTADQESLLRLLSADTYVLELVDDSAKYNESISEVTACFDVRVQRIN